MEEHDERDEDLHGRSACPPFDEHVNRCVAGALAAGDEQQAAARSRELLDAVQRFVRTT